MFFQSAATTRLAFTAFCSLGILTGSFIGASDDHINELKPGLYLEAGTAKVPANAFVSIPIYLRYRGNDARPPRPANMNSELTYDSTVAVAMKHPNRDRTSPSKSETAPPDLVRGNLLAGNFLIAGDLDKQGRVLAGFAGKKEVAPGLGMPGETLTEIYFRAVGEPGDRTELKLKVTMINDETGHEIPIETVAGWIKIIKKGTICTSTAKPPVKALDAYKALLMSIKRIPADSWLDANRDGNVTSHDSYLILWMTGQSSGEIPIKKDCSGGIVGPKGPFPPPITHDGRELGEQGNGGDPEISRDGDGGSGHDDDDVEIDHRNDGGIGDPDGEIDRGDPARVDRDETVEPEHGRDNEPALRDGGKDDTPIKPVTALDAYRALLMSVGRLATETRHDRNDDGKVNSLDASLILDEASDRPAGR